MIKAFSGVSEGGVRLGMFFMSNGDGIMAKFALGVDLCCIWGFEHIFCLQLIMLKGLI